LAQALDEANSYRPEHVPPDAVLLASWINLPGDNAQRGNWKKQISWKESLKSDFTACLDFQGHPGLIREPAVHIAMHVGTKGDDNNLLGRAKYVIDLLQTYKQTAKGKGLDGKKKSLQTSKTTQEGHTFREPRPPYAKKPRVYRKSGNRRGPAA